MEYIIAGLGNPGKKYEKTRHNTGFMALDFMAEKSNVKIESEKFKALYGTGEIAGKKVLFLKPQTFMNLSGFSVLAAMTFYKVKPENTLLIFDDASLPVGKIRIRKSGTHGGQNGVKNIIELCAADKFPRIKVGIGDKPNPDWNLADWVLSSFSMEEQKSLNSIFENVCEAAKLIIGGEIDEAMNRYNQKGITLKKGE